MTEQLLVHVKRRLNELTSEGRTVVGVYADRQAATRLRHEVGRLTFVQGAEALCGYPFGESDRAGVWAILASQGDLPTAVEISGLDLPSSPPLTARDFEAAPIFDD